MTLEIGDVVDDRYTIEREIGRGGMAIVYEAAERGVDRRVAIKRLLPSFAADRNCVARFEREARAASTLVSEHAVRIYGVGTTPDGAPYMAMELLTGRDLASLRGEWATRSTEKPVDWILGALDALADAHARGIVHRDVKPHNLFVARRADGSEIVKVLDFGIAKAAEWGDGQLTRTKDIVGSPAYMSPEQARSSRDVDDRTDIWSVGVCLYELLTGKLPFDAESVPEIFSKVLVADPTPPALLSSRIPTPLSDVVIRCLAKDVAARWPDVAALAAALEPFGSAASAGAAERIARVLGSRSEATAPAHSFAPPPESAAGSQTELMPDRPRAPAPASKKRGRQIVFAGGAFVLALVGYLGARSALPAGPTPSAPGTMDSAAPDDSIEELLPPPLPSPSDTVVEMSFDVDAGHVRTRPRSTHGSPRHRRPQPPAPAPAPKASTPAGRY